MQVTRLFLFIKEEYDDKELPLNFLTNVSTLNVFESSTRRVDKYLYKNFFVTNYRSFILAFKKFTWTAVPQVTYFKCF